MVLKIKTTPSNLFDGRRERDEAIKSKYDRALKHFESEFTFHKSVIVEEINKVATSVSIYLAGSFARNEGSFKFIDGKPTPLRDYDIVIVTNDLLDTDVIDKIRIQIHKRLGLPDPFSRDFKFGSFTVWITQTSLSSINAFPLLKYYELKHSSKLLWGKDIRDEIKIDFEDLSFYNGVLILFSKVEGLLGLLNIDNLHRKNSKENIDFIYECLKSYVEIGTCLSMLVGEYDHSFLGRNKKIYENFDTLFPELKNLVPDLSSKIIASSYERLLVADDFSDKVDLGDLLTGTLNDLKTAIWYYLREAYQTDIPYSHDYAAIFDNYLNKLNSKLLEDLFDFYIKKKVGFRSKFIRKLAVSVYLRYCSLKFFMICRKNGDLVKIRVLWMRKSNLMLRLWLTGFLVLESVQNNLDINELALHAAEKRLNEVIDIAGYRKFTPEETELKFAYLQNTESRLLDIADKIFHRKS